MAVYEEHEMSAAAAIAMRMRVEKEYHSDGRNAVGHSCGICGEKIKAGEPAEFRHGDWLHSDCLNDY